MNAWKRVWQLNASLMMLWECMQRSNNWSCGLCALFRVSSHKVNLFWQFRYLLYISYSRNFFTQILPTVISFYNMLVLLCLNLNTFSIKWFCRFRIEIEYRVNPINIRWKFDILIITKSDDAKVYFVWGIIREVSLHI